MLPEPPPELISIIMPAYNAAKTLARAIASVLEQSYPHWELIILDDGSTDETVAIAQSISDERIRIISLPHVGKISVLRNRGLKEARGEFIAFLDADDLYEGDALEQRYRYLKDHPNCTAVYGYFRWINEQDDFIQVGSVVSSLPEVPVQHTWKAILHAEIPTWLQGLMFRQSVLSRIQPFNEGVLINEDYLFFIELFLDRFDGVQSLPMHVFRYRHYAQSVTKSPANFERILENQPTFFKALFEHPKLQPMLAKCDKTQICRQFVQTIATIRLKFNQPVAAQKACWWALRYSQITYTDWIRHFLPILCLSFLPTDLREGLLQNVKRFRRIIRPLLTPVSTHHITPKTS